MTIFSFNGRFLRLIGHIFNYPNNFTKIGTKQIAST